MVAVVEVTISSAVARIPIAPSRSTYPARDTVELFVANRTATSRPCSQRASSDAPGTGSRPR
jgi:hypothetical protein